MILAPLPLPADAAAGCALWRIDLDQHIPAAARARLSADEMARARRFVFEHDRHRYIAAHAALRQLLDRHPGATDAPPHIVAGRFGKPALTPASGRLHFNLSHSQDTGLIALSTRHELGVDIERVRPMPDALALAAAYFSPAERAALAACPEAQRDRAFFVCWTRKEACLKAVGIGLHLALDGFEVGIEPVPQTVVMATPDGIEHLRLHSIEDGEGVTAALALRLSRHGPLTTGASASAAAPMEFTA
ncbi:4'-phosphopantetheinyl transferase family protein [Variovorax sp. LT1P1]|uniref:4'-phosphopantetheinyl transferase family protein n=1 Tax=Variovorax sp. LT1P1 TaxID=3443730 RepID=UPI003F48CB36